MFCPVLVCPCFWRVYCIRLVSRHFRHGLCVRTSLSCRNPIDIHLSLVVEILGQSLRDKRYPFFLVCTDKREPWLLAGDTDELRKEWVKNIRHVLFGPAALSTQPGDGEFWEVVNGLVIATNIASETCLSCVCGKCDFTGLTWCEGDGPEWACICKAVFLFCPTRLQSVQHFAKALHSS